MKINIGKILQDRLKAAGIVVLKQADEGKAPFAIVAETKVPELEARNGDLINIEVLAYGPDSFWDRVIGILNDPIVIEKTPFSLTLHGLLSKTPATIPEIFYFDFQYRINAVENKKENALVTGTHEAPVKMEE